MANFRDILKIGLYGCAGYWIGRFVQSGLIGPVTAGMLLSALGVILILPLLWRHKRR